MLKFNVLRKIVTILLSLISTCFFSCNEESLSLITESYSFSAEKEKLLLNSFAKTLAVTLKNEPELREIIKKESLKRIDGTYSVFYNIIKSQKTLNGKTIEEVLFKYTENKNDIIELSKNVLNLSIKIPVFKNASAETWEEKEFSPSVVVNSNSKESVINCYDSNGILTTKMVSIEPSDVTIIVERNQYVVIHSLETINEDIKNSLSTIYTANSLNEGKNMNSEGKVTQGFSSGVHNPYTLTPTQKESTRLYLGDIFIPENTWAFASDNWIENELYIDVKVYVIVGDSKQLDVVNKALLIPRYFVKIGYVDGRRRVTSESTANRWIDFKGDLSTRPDIGFWDRTKQGDTWKIVFSESDPGNRTIEETTSLSTTFTVGIKLTDSITKTFTGGFDASYSGTQVGTRKVNYTDVDDRLAESPVYFNDAIRREYSTGLISFTISASDGNCTGWSNTCDN